MSINPFKIDISQCEIDRLKKKLQDTRIKQASIVPNARDEYGPSIEWFHRLYKRWLDNYNWSSAQAQLNRHEHFLADIEDEGTLLKLHITHTRSPNPEAIPIILIHGWPGTFHEFDRVVDLLANPNNPNDPSFHVVVPSLPGFCFSSPPPRRAWTMQDTARLFHKLMLTLGYISYTAQAGHWGHFAARELGARYPEHCKAVHFNFCPVAIPDSIPEIELTDREKFVKKRCKDWLDDHLGYAVMMRTRPQTVGFMVQDNPAGILAWVGEKYEELRWPGMEKDAKKMEEWEDAILTTCSLYYFTNCVMTSSLPYFENVKHAGFGEFFLKKENYVGVPMGYTSYAYDSRPGTERTVKDTGRMVYYNECDEGGHFAALERPDVFVADCRKFFGEWYKP